MSFTPTVPFSNAGLAGLGPVFDERRQLLDDLECPHPSAPGPWAVLDRDGPRRRQVDGPVT